MSGPKASRHGRDSVLAQAAGLRALCAASVLTLVGLFWAPAARADYQCGNETDTCQCSANNPYPCCSNGGNCTWMAWHNACCNWGVGLPVGWGNANTWAPSAAAHPDYSIVANPVVGSIGCSNGGVYGHVVWVVAVNGSSIDVSEMNCCTTCNYGSRIWTYQASYFNQGFIVRTSCDCSTGDVQTQGCPRCGTQERTCDGCNWNPWGACLNQGPCESGQTETDICGDCGTYSRTCQSNCQWESWSACDGPDPLTPCDTGQPGLCSEGQQLCVSGNHVCEQTVFPGVETCDGRDEDCDGVTDEDGVCDGTDAGIQPDASTGIDGGPPPPDAAAPADDGGGAPADPTTVRGGCHCRTIAGSPADGMLPGILWLLLLAGLRRRRRPKN